MITLHYNAISLFSGFGGDSLGMSQAGCKIIAYNELRHAFCKSHDANFPDSELICEGKIHYISKLGQIQ
jgi:site-specific DNA-cytosine methylase